ncbi:MAG: YicC/YloC family endoribonuclease [Candidatus Gorgyraea atricola]|nr:YicC/YloC family endoribonuclease [Candidatus Gorgyraea atricola]
MIKSMTGFGKGESKSQFGRFTVELRTLNHRYFDISSRMPNNLGIFEDRIRNYINKHIKRGKVNLALSLKKNGKGFETTKIDHDAIQKYYKMLTKIKKRFNLKDEIKLSHILSFPDVIVQDQPEYDVNSVWPVLESAIKKAALDCNKMREEEGKALYKDLAKRLGNISYSMNKISSIAPSLVAQYKHKLDSKIKGLLKNKNFIDRSRLETELAIFAKQSDVSEELTRARSHIKATKAALSSNKEVGRRLDFILQELQREINTLGAKSSSTKISQLVIDIKSEIDKMREQVQNVE